jgi:glucose-6-phosphate-specific signal transduction histidine kinase
VTKRDGWVVGTIVDNGHGMERATLQGRGLGLIGMEERVKELGGYLRFVSLPGQGVRVEFQLPFVAQMEVSRDSDSDRGRSRDRSDRIETSA